jgi:hypothetical protein
VGINMPQQVSEEGVMIVIPVVVYDNHRLDAAKPLDVRVDSPVAGCVSFTGSGSKNSCGDASGNVLN